jgi:hypothetical protein
MNSVPLEVDKHTVKIDLMICSRWEKCLILTCNHLYLASVIKNFFNVINPETLGESDKVHVFSYYLMKLESNKVKINSIFSDIVEFGKPQCKR